MLSPAAVRQAAQPLPSWNPPSWSAIGDGEPGPDAQPISMHPVPPRWREGRDLLAGTHGFAGLDGWDDVFGDVDPFALVGSVVELVDDAAVGGGGADPAAADAGAGEGDVRVADGVDLALAVVVDAHVDPLRGQVASVGEGVGVLPGRDVGARAVRSAAGPVGGSVESCDLHGR